MNKLTPTTIAVCLKIKELKKATSYDIWQQVKIRRCNVYTYLKTLTEMGVVRRHDGGDIVYYTLEKVPFNRAFKEYNLKKEKTLQAQADKEGVSRQAIWERKKKGIDK